MADSDNWKARVGVEINYSSSDVDDDVGSNSSPFKASHSFLYNGDEQDSIVKSYDEQQLCAVMDEDEVLLYTDYERPSHRSDILERQKDRSVRKKEKDSRSFGNVKPHAKIQKKPKHVSRRIESFDGEDDENKEPTKMDIRRRKRSMNLLRDSERAMKRDSSDLTPYASIAEHGLAKQEGGNDGNLFRSLRQAVKTVETCKRFYCLTSKPVCLKEDVTDAAHSSKTVTPGCPQNRVDFYKTFSKVVRLGNADKNYAWQQSQQDNMFQNELKDLIWLELQAWHTGCTLTEKDAELYKSRENVGEVLDEISTYYFSLPEAWDSVTRGSHSPKIDSAVHSDFDEGSGSADVTLSTAANDSNVFLYALNMPSKEEYTLDGGAFSKTNNSDSPHRSCFNIYCQTCIRVQNVALSQVKTLLEKLDAVESLYPSRRALAEEYESYNSKDFTARVEVLISWYNLTLQLRQHIDYLGQFMTYLGARHLRWPTFGDACCSYRGMSNSFTDDGASGDESAGATSSSVNSNQSVMKESKCNRLRVQFAGLSVDKEEDVGDSSGISSNPSDSNNSTDSGGLIFDGRNVLPSPDHLHGDGGFSFSPYRKYAERLLKTKGLKKMLQMIERLLNPVLKKARKMFEDCTLHLNPEKTHGSILPNSPDVLDERWGSSFQTLTGSNTSPLCSYADLGLPAFRTAYLFLCRISLECIHECLKIRLEQKPALPTVLSIQQLLRESKETITAAVIEKRKYLTMIRSADWDDVVAEKTQKEMLEFDANVKAMLSAYLEYMLQTVKNFFWEGIQVTTHHKTSMEEEWIYMKSVCSHIAGGETLAAKTFCESATYALCGIEQSIRRIVEKNISSLHAYDDQEENFKSSLLRVCRELQTSFSYYRKKALKTVATSKMLRKDLELVSEFCVNVSFKEVLGKLKETDHIRVNITCGLKMLIFIPGVIKKQPLYVSRMLNLHCGRDESFSSTGDPIDEGYLLFFPADNFSNKVNMWEGETVDLKLLAETVNTLSNIPVNELMLIVFNAAHLSVLRRHFVRIMGDTVSIKTECCSADPSIVPCVQTLKVKALRLRDTFTEMIQKIEQTCDVRDVEDLDESDWLNLSAKCRETLHQCYKVGFDYHKELRRLITGKAKRDLALGQMHFAKQWMAFVVSRCERGRGVRPRWSAHGVEFLMMACEPQNTVYLTDKEFEELQSSIDQCISHVIGSPDKTSTSKCNIVASHSRGSSPSPLSRKPYRPSRSLQEVSVSGADGNSRSPSLQTPRVELGDPHASPLLSRRRQGRSSKEETTTTTDSSTPDTLQVPLVHFGVHGSISQSDRILLSVGKLDSERDTELRERGVIGQVAEKHAVDRRYIRAKSVTFSWQRGIKIGQGRFGKVYTAVNNQTGELMAVKEIQLQPNDHRTIRTVYDELRIFEGIHHKHLVRHYGVEVHREEMLIFMEYCAEGTLESLAASTENGLTEDLVRYYTNQLLQAVGVLHFHGIVHRDIKSANIFLTDDGNSLKLGDFGCAVKIKAHTTMAGELQGFVGTQAYMAPEVFTKNLSEGHGRAADIWSLGCVVIELASGKRPWYELENNYQIMFRVGMGEKPRIPENLSKEGLEFVEKCLEQDPRARATAGELLSHNFVKVEHDEETFNSLPLYTNPDDVTL